MALDTGPFTIPGKIVLTNIIGLGPVILHLTNNEADVNKDVAADLALLGDARLVLRQLIEEVRRQGGRQAPSPAEEIAAVKQEWLARWRPKLTSDEVPINPYRVLHDLMGVVDRARAIITHDSGMPRDQLAPFWEALAPRGFLGWGKSTQPPFPTTAVASSPSRSPDTGPMANTDTRVPGSTPSR